MLKLFTVNKCYIHINRNGKAPIHFGVPVLFEPLMILIAMTARLIAVFVIKFRGSR